MTCTSAGRVTNLTNTWTLQNTMIVFAYETPIILECLWHLKPFVFENFIWVFDFETVRIWDDTIYLTALHLFNHCRLMAYSKLKASFGWKRYRNVSPPFCEPFENCCGIDFSLKRPYIIECTNVFESTCALIKDFPSTPRTTSNKVGQLWLFP